MSRTGTFDPSSSRLPNAHIVRSPTTPRKARRPEKHQCLGVHNNVTQPLSQPFVSATLALRELLSISWRESGIPAPHPSRVLSPVDGPLPRLFPRPHVRLSAAFTGWMPPLCTTVISCASCNYPRHGHRSPWTLLDNFSPLFVLAHQELALMASGQ